MNLGSPSCHPSDAEEEDSPLQLSAHPSHPLMAESYLEDIMSKVEQETAGQTAEEEVDGGAEEEKQDDGVQAEEEQIPRNLHGY
jgi:hypothetical protein